MSSFLPPAAIALRLLRWGVVVVIGAWFLVLGLWLALHWLILPNIDQWRSPIEQRAGAALGLDVKIGRIEVQSHSWVPAFRLHDVVLRDRAGREALRLPQVAAALSARSLLQLEPHFTQLLIDAPMLEARRDAAGRVWLAGFELDAGERDDGSAADWFFNQREFVIRGGTLRWIDEQRGSAPLEFADVQLLLRNGLRRHELRLDATPPAALGERFSVRAKLSGALLARRGDWRRWSGTLHAELPQVDVSALRAHAALPYQFSAGRGSLRGWLELERGRPMSATLDAALPAVTLRADPALAPLALAQLSGRFEAARSSEGWSLAAHQLAFDTADGRHWPAGDLRLALRQQDDGSSGAPATPLLGGEFSADRLDLALLAALSAHAPLPDASRRTLDELAPRGIVAGLKLNWDGSPAAPSRYQLDARVEGLALAPRPAASPAPRASGRPGLRNAALTVSATERGGSGSVSIADGSLEFPGVFDDPLVPLQAFDARVAWRIAEGADAPQVEVDLRDVRFANADLSGRFDATWTTGAGTGRGRGGRLPGLLDLQGQVDSGRATRVARYLPRALPAEARRYVEQAVRAGSVAAVNFKVKGDLADFPASNVQQGEFRIAGRVVDTSFDFAPGRGWPEIGKLDGELIFDRSAMLIRNARGQLAGWALDALNGGIANLAERPVFALDGHARGTLADGLAFVNKSPLGVATDHALAQASGSGNAELKLALEVPLDERPNTAKGSVALAGNDIRLRPDTPLLRNAAGRVDFTQDGFSVVGASARVLGGDATFEGGSQADGSVRFNGQGTLGVEGLREWASTAPLAALLAGQAPYKLALGFVHGQPEVQLTSPLQGIAINLPAPLAKPADSALALRVQTRVDGNGARDSINVELGDALQAHWQRDLAGAAPRVLRGGIGIGAPAPLPAAGVQALLRLPKLDVDAWQHAAERLGERGGAGEAADGYLPASVALEVGELAVQGRRLTALVAGASRQDGNWRATLRADQLSGYGEWRPEARGPGELYARLAHLTLPPSDAASVDSLLDASPPALDVEIDDFTLRGKRLGRVEIEAETRAAGAGAGHDWRLAKLALAVPEARLDASSPWMKPAAAGQRRRSVLDLKLTISDAGALVERFGTHGALRGGKGHLSGQLAWDGSPLSPEFPSLAGTLELAVDNGQFLKAEPGAARLLGVLSLQALPRRLALDFRDVFQEGFVFDSASGNVTVDKGVARSNNLSIRGVQAAVLMEGDADLVRETQDLRVVVVPEINAGTASLAYAVINPAVGLGTFLAQLLLRKPIIAAGTREFHVTGPWADPKVEAVPHVAAPAEGEAPASAPTAGEAR